MQDLYGNKITTHSEKTVDAVNRFSESLIGFGVDFGVIFEASDGDPDCAIANSLAGLLGLFLETPDRLEIADKYFVRAKNTMSKASEREQIFVSALLASRDQDVATSLKCHRELAEKYPRDLLSAKIGQTQYFNLGDDDGMLWLADRVIDAHRDTAYAHGMRAFGLEQMSQLGEAEEEARRATHMRKCDPWAHHAAAHVMITEGRHDEGISWMNNLSDQWDGCNSFMYTHNWWHLALFHLELEEFSQALDLYDTHIWGRDKTYSQDQINAISMLWRLEIAGVDVGDRWENVADFVAARTFVNDQPFLDMQYVFALARAGREEALNRLMASMEMMRRESPLFTRTAWAEVAIPAAKAFVAYAKGDFKLCLALLAPARAQLQSIGGSHAQRDLFEQVWIQSLLKEKDFGTALPLIQARLDFRKPVKLDMSLMHMAKSASLLA
ncbi:hypothetical protein A9Q83_06270 [Alphaproteobacteria bacterium 46_93_T64]|nr:hypothetical protein A9Q83_06270 [Alphaproteobacteria bacterium 46_93_T64]